MKKLILALGLLSVAGTALAAGKPCEELKAEIAAKLDGKGVSGYTLEIVENTIPAKPPRTPREIGGGAGALHWRDLTVN